MTDYAAEPALAERTRHALVVGEEERGFCSAVISPALKK